MGPFGDSSMYYSGNECYRHIEGLVSKGKDILIISPYIDEYYARFLLGKAGSRNIRILSSSMNGNAKKILTRNSNKGTIMAVIVVLAGTGYLAYGTRLFGAVVLISAVAVAILLLSLANRGKGIVIRRPQGFVHAKLYISESKAIHGSANLTYNGTHSNIEHIEIIRDMEKIAKLRKEFERMWGNST